jgi:hypothetical protein
VVPTKFRIRLSLGFFSVSLFPLLVQAVIAPGRGPTESVERVQLDPQWKALNSSQSPWTNLSVPDFVAAFRDPEIKAGRSQDSAACAFPARKKVLERITGETFPSPLCADLRDWKKRLNAGSVSLVFAGSYAGNPASILGHTFLRFSAQEKTTEASELLSYSLAYSAQPDSKDGRLTYIFKGLTGGYWGLYQIEPHYIKVGLYNNSESRDLWEWPVPLSPEELDLLIDHVWELVHSGMDRYYFVDKNCSYRILKILQVVRPELDLTEQFFWIVEPSETLRNSKKAGWITGPPRYRASMGRRLEHRLKHLTSAQKTLYRNSFRANADISQVTDVPTLDALLDHWTLENYKAGTLLSAEDERLRRATLRQRALQSEVTAPVSDQAVMEYFALKDPLQGHPARHVRAGSSAASFRAGFQPLWASGVGYDDLDQFEYLGFDWNYDKTPSLVFIDVLSLPDFSGTVSTLSWGFAFRFLSPRETPFPGEDNRLVHASGAVGVSLTKSYLLLEANSQQLVARVGFYKDLRRWRLAFEGRQLLFDIDKDHPWNFRLQGSLSYALRQNWSLLLEGRDEFSISAVRFF